MLEDIWVSILSFFETRQLFLLKSVCKLFINLINSTKIKKVVKLDYYLSFESNTIDNLVRMDNIYYIVNSTRKIEKSFIEKYSHQIIRLEIYSFSSYLVKLLSRMTDLTFLALNSASAKNSDISCLTNIHSLDLTYNTMITDTIFTLLTNITNLCLISNRCVTNEGISRLTNIKHLDLGCNDMITNGALSCLTNITMLNLFHNKIITHEGISGLTNIRGLDLQDNIMIGDESIMGLTNITYLNLKNNNKVTNRSLTRLISLNIVDVVDNKEVCVSSNVVVRRNAMRYLEFA